MTLQTWTEVRAGSGLATFDIRLPFFGTMDTLNSPLIGRPFLLDAVYPSTKVLYGLGLKVTRKTYTYGFRLEKAFHSDKTMLTLNDRFKDHFTNGNKAFMGSVPTPFISYVNSPKNKAHFKLELPGKTSVYSSWPDFFDALGLAEYQVFERAMTGRGSGADVTKVFGYINDTLSNKTIEGDIVLESQTWKDMLGDVEPPEYVQVQIEIPETITASAYAAGPVGRNKLTDILGTLLTLLSKKCNLITNYIRVSNPDKNIVRFANSVLPQSGITIDLYLSPETAASFNVDSTGSYSFNLNITKAHDFMLAPEGTSPLTGKYPITILLIGFGQATSWVKGIGYCTHFGVMRQDGKKSISEGLAFTVDNFSLTVQLLDNFHQPIVFDHTVNMYFSIKFERPIK